MTAFLIAQWFTAVLAMLFALDAWTTWQVFRFGGFEKSPLVCFLMGIAGLAFMVSMYVAIVWHNWQQLQIHKGGPK